MDEIHVFLTELGVSDPDLQQITDIVEFETALAEVCNIALSQSTVVIIGMAKVLPIINVLGYDGQNSSFSSSSPPPHSDSTPITQEESHISI